MIKNKHYTIDSLNLMYKAYLHIIEHRCVGEYPKTIDVYFSKIRQSFDMDIFKTRDTEDIYQERSRRSVEDYKHILTIDDPFEINYIANIANGFHGPKEGFHRLKVIRDIFDATIFDTSLEIDRPIEHRALDYFLALIDDPTKEISFDIIDSTGGDYWFGRHEIYCKSQDGQDVFSYYGLSETIPSKTNGRIVVPPHMEYPDEYKLILVITGSALERIRYALETKQLDNVYKYLSSNDFDKDSGELNNWTLHQKYLSQ